MAIQTKSSASDKVYVAGQARSRGNSDVHIQIRNGTEGANRAYGLSTDVTNAELADFMNEVVAVAPVRSQANTDKLYGVIKLTTTGYDSGDGTVHIQVFGPGLPGANRKYGFACNVVNAELAAFVTASLQA